MDGADGLAGPLVDALLEDRQWRLWIGFQGEGLDCFSGSNLVHYTTAQGLPGKQVRVLVEDALGRIWIGTGEGRVARFSDGRFEAEMALPGSGAVSAIVPLDDGTLWVGTTVGGLVRVRPGAALRVTAWHGLPDDFISDLEADDAGNLWCGSSRGLFRVALATNRPVKVVAWAWGLCGGSAPERIRLIQFGQAVRERMADNSGQSEINLKTTLEAGYGLWLAACAKDRDGSEAITTPVYIVRSGFRFWDVGQAGKLIERQLVVLSEIEVALAECEKIVKACTAPLDYWTRWGAEQAD